MPVVLYFWALSKRESESAEYVNYFILDNCEWVAATEFYRVGCTGNVYVGRVAVVCFESGFEFVDFFLSFVFELIDFHSHFLFLFGRHIAEFVHQ